VKVFISWSGDRSKALAKALNDWLPKVIQVIDPFYSPDMEKGINWITEILDQLADTTFGIICVTPGNMRAPWINLEAGALAKAIPGSKNHVVPIALGFDSPNGLELPLSAFNSMLATEEAFLGLVKTLNNQLKRQLDNTQLEATFKMWWPELDTAIKAALANHPEDVQPVRSDNSKIDEVLSIVKDLARGDQGQISSGYISAVSPSSQGGLHWGAVAQGLQTTLAPASAFMTVGRTEPAIVSAAQQQEAVRYATKWLHTEFDYNRETVNLIWAEPDVLWIETDRPPSDKTRNNVTRRIRSIGILVEFHSGGARWTQRFLPEDKDDLPETD
jgi:hypothetical protein